MDSREARSGFPDEIYREYNLIMDWIYGKWIGAEFFAQSHKFVVFSLFPRTVHNICTVHFCPGIVLRSHDNHGEVERGRMTVLERENLRSAC